MTIKETVKQALTTVPGNKPFIVGDLIWSDQHFQLVNYSNVQIRRALRDIPYVRKLADGRYVVKGRRVPPKTQPPTVASRTLVDDIPDYELADHERAIVQQGEWY